MKLSDIYKLILAELKRRYDGDVLLIGDMQYSGCGMCLCIDMLKARGRISHKDSVLVHLDMKDNKPADTREGKPYWYIGGEIGKQKRIDFLTERIKHTKERDI